jgi:glycosyltransferase involved in cell wall biosynthesis
LFADALTKMLSAFQVFPKQSRVSPETPFVSVIVTCYNYGKYLLRAVQSVHEQTFRNFELIVIDAGSSDGVSKQIVESIQLERTTVFKRETRSLVGSNRNFGIERSRGKYICCLDADDYFEPTYIEKAIIVLEGGKYDLVSTRYKTFGERTELVELPVTPTFDQIVGGASMPSVAIFKKNLWKQLGGFRDTGIGAEHIPEDWDFFVRAACLGTNSFNLSENLLNVRWHADSLNRSSENMTYQKQADLIKERCAAAIASASQSRWVDGLNDAIHFSELKAQLESTLKVVLSLPPDSADSTAWDLHLKCLEELRQTVSSILVLGQESLTKMPPKAQKYFRANGCSLFSLDDLGIGSYERKFVIDYFFKTRNIMAVVHNGKILRTPATILGVRQLFS